MVMVMLLVAQERPSGGCDSVCGKDRHGNKGELVGSQHF